MRTFDLQKLKGNLFHRGFSPKIFETPEDILQDVRSLVNSRTVGFGSSLTIKSMGIIDAVRQNAREVFTHLPGEYGDNEKSALTADLFFTSANAVSLDGEIVNIDGTGNRVAATCFGPKKVIYIIGSNKISCDLNSAIERAKVTAVKIAKQFNKKTPCVKTGKCENCLSPDCVCAITTIHRKKPHGTDISVWLIDGEYGI